MHVILANKLGAFTVLLGDSLERACGDLSSSAATLLLTLYYNRNTTATTLAKVAGITQPTAVRVLDGLVRRGLIERKSRTGRTTLLRATPGGERKARALQTARLQAMNEVLGGLRARERSSLEQLMDTILASATTSRTQARTICRLCDHGLCHGRLCPVGTRASEIERHSEL